MPCQNSATFSLRPHAWAAIFRVLWLLGYASNAESYASAKIRAKQASSELVQLSKEHGHIMCLGHGIFNRLIVKELLKSGWQGSKTLSAKYWGFAVYEALCRGN